VNKLFAKQPTDRKEDDTNFRKVYSTLLDRKIMQSLLTVSVDDAKKLLEGVNKLFASKPLIGKKTIRTLKISGKTTTNI
jgi:hypothetical protein